MKKGTTQRPNNSVAEIHGYAFKKVTPKDKNVKNEQPSQLKTPSLLKALTVYIVKTYSNASTNFKYTSTLNPRRVLTKNSEPASNDNYDNATSDYILYVNDILGSYTNHQYQVMDLLGQGTFGQVVKCQNIATKDLVAIKIVKNKPAYFNQGLVEIQILELLNHQYDAENKNHIVRLLDYFVFRNHLCLVFELLGINLYELIKQNQFRGLSRTVIRCFMIQILESLCCTAKAGVIHCDLKPENILLENSTSPAIKIIDFGSACFENQTVYSYIQSRFYRSPEVLIGVKYNGAIDMWSLGCICAELFLGLPLLPGNSEYNQLARIMEFFGELPTELLNKGEKTRKLFNYVPQSNGTMKWVFKEEDQYSRENNMTVPPSKKYFKYKTFPEIVENYSLKEGMAPADVKLEKDARRAFIDMVQGLLTLDPEERWTAEQAIKHPFITGEPFTGPWVPEPKKKKSVHTAPRVIPWGIQGGFANSQASRHVSMSFPEHMLQPTLSLSVPESSSFAPRDFYGPPVVPPLALSGPGGFPGVPVPFEGSPRYGGNFETSPRGVPMPQQSQNMGYGPPGASPRTQSMASPRNRQPNNHTIPRNSPRQTQYSSPRQNQYNTRHTQYYPTGSSNGNGNSSTLSNPNTTNQNNQTRKARRQRSKSDISPSQDKPFVQSRRNSQTYGSPRNYENESRGRSHRSDSNPNPSSQINPTLTTVSNTGSRRRTRSFGQSNANNPNNQPSQNYPPPQQYSQLSLTVTPAEPEKELERERDSSDSTSPPSSDSSPYNANEWDEDMMFQLEPESQPPQSNRSHQGHFPHMGHYSGFNPNTAYIGLERAFSNVTISNHPNNPNNTGNNPNNPSNFSSIGLNVVLDNTRPPYIPMGYGPNLSNPSTGNTTNNPNPNSNSNSNSNYSVPYQQPFNGGQQTFNGSWVQGVPQAAYNFNNNNPYQNTPPNLAPNTTYPLSNSGPRGNFYVPPPGNASAQSRYCNN